MRFAFGVLHWSPDVFWKASMREICAAMEAYSTRTAPEPLDVEDLKSLMDHFPDD
jgi:hypothetical protein